MRTLLWQPTGLKIAYNANERGSGIRRLHVSDLNPEVSIIATLSRLETLRLGLRFIRASLSKRVD